MVEAANSDRGVRKRRQGVVANRSGDKSIVVRVERRVRHPLYGKILRRATKYHVHDDKNAAQVGDKVTIEECRPISRMKRWRLQEILSTSRQAVGADAS